jgi:putative transposase
VEWKNEESLSWLKEAPSQCLQQSLRDLDKAFRNFFTGKSQYPKFKRKVGMILSVYHAKGLE